MVYSFVSEKTKRNNKTSLELLFKNFMLLNANIEITVLLI